MGYKELVRCPHHGEQLLYQCGQTSFSSDNSATGKQILYI